jgi:hypothetical protein
VVADVVGAYLDAVDVEVPGLVEGLYLVGSVALGDFRPRTSDIDYLAVTAVRPEGSALAALRRVHHRLRARGRPYFDGVYVTWEDLARDPIHAGPGPSSHEGRFQPPRRGGCDPVAWHTLALHGVACRGPAPDRITVRTDRSALAAWAVSNLDSYWRRLLRQAARSGSLWGAATLTPYGAVWIVTGVSRMHYTLATGGICSKEDSCRYALATFPERWHRVVNEAARIRRADFAGSGIAGTATDALRYLGPGRPLYRRPWARRTDVLAFGDVVITDAIRGYGDRPTRETD